MKRLAALLILFTQIIVAQNELTHEVYFETDNYNVLETENNRLLLFIENLQKITIEKIAIYGFCDDRASDAYNLVLSQNRANSIKNILTKNKIDESLITNVDGKGEILLKIVKESGIEKIRGLNRKVEIIVNPKFTEKKVEEKKSIFSTDLKKGDKVVLEKLYFKMGYSVLTPNSVKVLKQITDTLVKRKELYFTIQGHVCCTQYSRDAIDRKTRKRNLSVERAKFVYNYFAKKGVSKKRMKYVGMRRKFPIGGDSKYDRRVEILITHVADKNK